MLNMYFYYSKERRYERNPPPPRFARGAAAANRGRGARGGRGRGVRGGGGNTTPTPGTTTNPPLIKQNSSDFGNEEWETASESSDVLEKCDSRDDLRRDREKTDAKKSFSGQRPGNDRPNRTNQNENRKSNSMERSVGGGGGGGGQQGKDRGNVGRGSNGQAGGHRGGGNSRNRSAPRNQVNAVYVVDGVLPENPAAIQNAISSLQK